MFNLFRRFGDETIDDDTHNVKKRLIQISTNRSHQWRVIDLQNHHVSIETERKEEKIEHNQKIKMEHQHLIFIRFR